jgi:16S rRNA (cytidine1402-2'-O)-methyltransferase
VPRLVLVPTPIGSLRDITLRALDVLRSADVVAAEDTRHTRGLLHHHGIATALVRLDAHTIPTRGRQVLSEHDTVAFVSDAGTPGISDPGADLLHLALSLGHEVEVLPGATAFVPAVVLADVGTARFTFEGFLPRSGATRGRRLAAIANRDHPTVVYESPRRLVDTLDDMSLACGPDRRASVSRELTKLHEETVRDTLVGLVRRYRADPPRGECVVVVGGRAREDDDASAGTLTVDVSQIAGVLAERGLHGRSLHEALMALGVPRNEAYVVVTRIASVDETSS